MYVLPDPGVPELGPLDLCDSGFRAITDSAKLLFALTIDPETGTAVLCLAGELDLACADGLRPLFEEAISYCARRLTVEVSGVTFVDSAGLDCLTGAARDAAARGVGFELSGRSRAVDRLVDAMGRVGIEWPRVLAEQKA